MIEGNDIVGIAQTGTGKTASFVLPILHKISESHKYVGAKRCSALILVPTRELAAQITDAITQYGQFMRHSTTLVVGGVKPGPQVRAMSKGVDILVATPGRLEDLMGTGAIKLDGTSTVVLDEADQMLDLGFFPAIRRIMTKLPKARQTALLSATMPKQIRALADDFLSNPEEISVAPASKPIDRIEQKVIHVAKANKRDKLTELLKTHDAGSVIVFTRTKHGANKVVQNLEKVGITAAAIHGNKSQGQRQRTLGDFRSGKLTVLIATDIAARGIDVDGVSLVVNYELPNVPEVYVHRIGRTARAGKSGIALTLCDGAERDQLRDIEKLIGRAIPSEGEPIDAPKEDKQAKKKPAKSKPRKPRPEGEKTEQRQSKSATKPPKGNKQRSGAPKQKAKQKASSRPKFDPLFGEDTSPGTSEKKKSHKRKPNKRRGGDRNEADSPQASGQKKDDFQARRKKKSRPQNRRQSNDNTAPQGDKRASKPASKNNRARGRKRAANGEG